MTKPRELIMQTLRANPVKQEMRQRRWQANRESNHPKGTRISGKREEKTPITLERSGEHGIEDHLCLFRNYTVHTSKERRPSKIVTVRQTYGGNNFVYAPGYRR